MPKVKGYIEVTFRLAKEGDQWTAECLELGTAAYADTIDEVLEAIRDLVGLHLNALEDVATRKAFFHKHGIRFHRGDPPERQRARQLRARPGELVQRWLQPLAMAGTG